YTTFLSSGLPNFTGRPLGGVTWLSDGEHFLQVKEGRLRKVHAATGRSTPFHDPAKLAAGLATLPTIKKTTAEALAQRTFFQMNPQQTGSLFEVGNDLYYCNFDGTGAARLTKGTGRAELVSFSPDGKLVAFVRDHNLYVVDLATKTERALTTDGTG